MQFMQSPFLKKLRAIFIGALLFLFTFVFFCFASEGAIRLLNLPYKTALDKLRTFTYKDPPIDAQGKYRTFRQGHFSVKKAPGTFRILALGGSYTWGDKIYDVTDTWPGQLERLLNAQDPSRHYEVLNFGANGFTTFNEAEFMRLIGWKLNPDMLVIQFALSSALPSEDNFRHAGEDSLYVTKTLLPKRAHEWLSAHSYFYSWIDQKFQLIQAKIFYPDGYAPLYDAHAKGWGQCRFAMAEMGREAHARGVRILLAIFPVFPRGIYTRNTYPYSRLHDRVIRTAALCGLETLDLLDVFLRKGKKLETYYALPLDPHPNEFALGLAAKAIAQTITNAANKA